MFVCRLKNFIKTALALGLSLAVLMTVRAAQTSRFAQLDGQRSFYLHSPTSQALIKEELCAAELFCVQGESVVFACENREETLAELLALYGAEALFTEEAGGTVSYYCVTPRWLDGVVIEGVFVNLHIAFDGELCAVGSPLIFGGF